MAVSCQWLYDSNRKKKDKGPYHPEFTFQQGGSLVSNPLLSRLGGVRAHEQRLDRGREGE